VPPRGDDEHQHGDGRAAGAGRCTPRALSRCLRDEIATMRAKLDDITTELEQAGDIIKLEALLKRYQSAPATYHGEADWY
jgi:hypothetical protein